MSVHEDLGFSAPTAEDRRKPATPQHRWAPTVRTFGASRFRCQRCGAIKTTNHAERATKYAIGHKITALAPPCIGAQQ
jgi:hypothetical protein